jgi:hypothetical protein
MKANEFRILGQELGEKDSFIDVEVSGIDTDGTIYFSDVDSSREWPLENSEVRRLLGQNLMIESSMVSENKLWKLAITVDQKGIGNASDEFAVENVVDAQKSIFLAAYFENR